MIRRSQLVRLRDILDTIDAVTEMIAGVDFGAYCGDLKLRRAVARCVEIEYSEKGEDSSYGRHTP